MRTYGRFLVFGAVAVAAMLIVAASGWGNARALETFDLGERDHFLAESAGCQVECRAFGPQRRTCVIKDYDCRAVCMEIPDCKTPGKQPPRVCAVVRTKR